MEQQVQEVAAALAVVQVSGSCCTRQLHQLSKTILSSQVMVEMVGTAALVERVAQIYIYTSLMGRATPLPKEFVDIERELFRMQRDAGLPEKPMKYDKGEKW